MYFRCSSNKIGAIFVNENLPQEFVDMPYEKIKDLCHDVALNVKGTYDKHGYNTATKIF